MAQNFTDDVYNTSHTVDTDMQNIENNFGCVKSMFSGSSAPTNPVGGQLWLDTGNKKIKVRDHDNNAWVTLITISSVTTSNYLDLAIRSSAIQANAITSSMITAGNVTDSHIVTVASSKVTGSLPSTSVTYGAGAVIFSKAYSSYVTGEPPVWDSANNDALRGWNFVPGSGSTLQIMRIFTFVPYGAKYVRGDILGICPDGCYLKLGIGTTYGTAGSISAYTETTGNFGYLDVSTHAGERKILDVYIYGVGAGKSLTVNSMCLFYCNT